MTWENLVRALEAPDEDNAFVSRADAAALEEGEAALVRLDARRPRSRLDGVPLAVKDNIWTDDGLATSAGAAILAGWKAPADATVVARLRAAGAVVVGKTNMDAFGMGSTGEGSAFGPTANPRAPDRVPGGSSSGSAAAVARGLVPLALGSDTGGSVRVPASYCGVYGLKPSYGRLSRSGLVPFASSLDCIGLLSSDLDLLEAGFTLAAGLDPRDATTDAGRGTALPARPALGIPAQWMRALAPEHEALLDLCRERGCAIEVFDVPDFDLALGAYHVTAAIEASSNLARHDGIHFGQRAEEPTYERTVVMSRLSGLGAEPIRRVFLGTSLLADTEDWYGRAQAGRARVTRAMEEALRRYDLLVGPVAPEAPAFGAPPAVCHALDRFTAPASLAGTCALSVPLPESERPVGLQVVGPRFGEERLLELARRLERWGATAIREPG